MLRSLCRYFGTQMSLEWAFGASGYAFALNINGDALCPSGPTAWKWWKGFNLGIRDHLQWANSGSADLPAVQGQIWDRIRAAVDAGLPGIGWELAEEEEWRIIYGYDQGGNYLFKDFDGSQLKVHHSELGTRGIGCSEAGYVEPGELYDDRELVRGSAVYALACSEGEFAEGGRGGIDGYNAWIAALDKSDLGDGWGCAYNTAVWAEARSMVPGYFTEAKRRLADPSLEALIDGTAGHYSDVAMAMATLAGLFPCDKQDKEGMAVRANERGRREQAVLAVMAARDAETQGLRSVAQLARALGPS